LNRAAFHDGDVASVVWARKQFSFTFEKPPKDGNLREYNRAIAGQPTKGDRAAFCEMVMRVESIFKGEQEDPPEGATFYYSPRSMLPKGSIPSWVDKTKEHTYDLGARGQFYRCLNGRERC
jgi:hypothetical protein